MDKDLSSCSVTPVSRCENHFVRKEEDRNKEMDRLDSIFQLSDLTLKIGNRKLYVTQEEFKQISVVFEKMLTSDFQEKKKNEIVFTGKDYKSFVLFIRVAHPGIQDPFEEDTIHQILPLIDEYLAEDARIRADWYLTKLVKKKSDSITSTQIVQNIIEAEKYKLPKYLNACMNVACRKVFNKLSHDADFEHISLETRFKISLHRWKLTDECYDQATKAYSMNQTTKQLGEAVYNMIKNN
ncbi:uncharacterized protein LOC143048045 [Mytilus galloprovincialis]|uniref:BTB and MATH domain-containing protein 38-like n=1 Tax=Mytilus edulis TaxID=6550 RepID=UPI0039F0C48A